MAEPGAVSVAAIAIGQTVVAYQFFMPSVSEVRRADAGDPGIRGDVLLGQIGAGGVSLAIGVMLASLSGSHIPVWATVFVAAIIAGVYHYAMKV